MLDLGRAMESASYFENHGVSENHLIPIDVVANGGPMFNPRISYP